ncbi:MAG: tryptophan--tRNA ligase [Bacteroidales bacterium]|jgi:tryptophanyl-tRNA synthetase|nr:tryptophan--tRNA ligase [Bacteroidales bacterium]
MSNKIVLSGVRPTGNLHLGNYFGALRNFVRMQEDYKCYFFIADLHSLTTHPAPEDLKRNVRNILANYLACGIDPAKSVIYAQSALPETTELYLYLNMLASLGELSRCTSFKDKARDNPSNINAGLLTYPTLMAADILIHKSDYVPVGKDQLQHLEMTRDFANRFNSMYKTDYFNEPQAFNFGEKALKVPGLDGKSKMGKSEGEMNAIYLSDTDEAIRKKVMRAVTDSGPTAINQEKPEVIDNLFSLVRLISGEDTFAYFNEQYNNMAIRYGDMKKQLAEDAIKFVAPFRERIVELLADNTYLDKVLAEGALLARESGSKTIKEVREIIGL